MVVDKGPYFQKLKKDLLSLASLNLELNFSQELKQLDHFAIELGYVYSFAKTNSQDGLSIIGSSSAFDKNIYLSIRKTLSESLERYCLSIFRPQNLVIEKIKNTGTTLNLNALCNNKRALENYSQEIELHWTECERSDGTKTLIPAQLIYCPFTLDKFYFRGPSSTGTCSRTSECSAKLYAILEVIERNDFITLFLSDSAPFSIVENQQLQYLHSEIIQRLEISNNKITLFKINPDHEYDTIMCCIEDNSNLSTNYPLSIGISTSLNGHDAINASFLEAVRNKLWCEYQIRNWNHSSEHKLKRIAYWRDIKNKVKLKKMLSSSKHIELSKRETEPSEGLEKVQQLLNKKQVDIYYKRLSDPAIEDNGFFVYKAIIPDLHPLHIDEGDRYDRSTFFPKQLAINSFPHPFV